MQSISIHSANDHMRTADWSYVHIILCSGLPCAKFYCAHRPLCMDDIVCCFSKLSSEEDLYSEGSNTSSLPAMQ